MNILDNIGQAQMDAVTEQREIADSADRHRRPERARRAVPLERIDRVSTIVIGQQVARCRAVLEHRIGVWVGEDFTIG